MIRLEAVLDSWRSIRADTAQAVLDMPAGELDFKPVPEMSSFREIAQHVLNASYALTGLLLEGVDDFTAPDFRSRMASRFPPPAGNAGAEELAAALRSRLDERLAELAAQPPEFFSRMMTRFDGARLTNLEMVEAIKDHELTHRSQMFVYLRLKGVVPATTRRRMARK